MAITPEPNFEGYHIRKWYTFIEDTLANETGRLADGAPLRKFAIAAAIHNPCAGRYSQDLSTIVAPSPKLGHEFGRRVKELAAAQGRKLRFGIRAYVIVRETKEEAWAAAQWQYDRMDAAAIERRLEKLKKTDTEGDNLLASLIGTGKALPKDARGLEIHPGVGGGIGHQKILRLWVCDPFRGSIDGAKRLFSSRIGRKSGINQASRATERTAPLIPI